MQEQVADKLKIQFKFDQPVDFSYKIQIKPIANEVQPFQLKADLKQFNFGSYKLGTQQDKPSTEPKTKFNFAQKADPVSVKQEKQFHKEDEQQKEVVIEKEVTLQKLKLLKENGTETQMWEKFDEKVAVQIIKQNDVYILLGKIVGCNIQPFKMRLSELKIKQVEGRQGAQLVGPNYSVLKSEKDKLTATIESFYFKLEDDLKTKLKELGAAFE